MSARKRCATYICPEDISNLEAKIAQLKEEVSSHNVQITQAWDMLVGLHSKLDRSEEDKRIITLGTLASESSRDLMKSKNKEIETLSDELKTLKKDFKIQQEGLGKGLVSPPPAKKTCMEAPVELGVSCSSATSTMISRMETTGFIFHHKFALEMYNLRQRLNKGDYDEFQFMGTTYKPDKECLDELITKWSQVDSFEKARTPYLSCTLDRFLFFGKGDGYCLHQGALGSNASSSNFPDFCIVPNDSKNDPATCVAISDYKNDNHSAAVIESKAYSFKSKEKTREFRNMRLVFPMTQETAELYIHYPIDKKVVSIRVFPAEEDERASPDKTFFCMLYAGVHQLLKKNIVGDGMLHITDSLELHPTVDETNDTVKRTFWGEDHTMYKFFGHNSYSNANIEVVKMLFPDAEQTFLTDDHRYSYISYKRKEGTHVPFTPYKKQQFANLLKQLDKLHEMGYVHSDIRMVNLVFSQTNGEAWLIDFDLTDKEGTLYPVNFLEFDCRHPTAKPGYPRMRIQDVYSLSKIAEATCSASDIFEKFSDGNSLAVIAEELCTLQAQQECVA